MRLTVARIGRAHGIAGEVSVETRTDNPQARYARGSVLHLVPPRGQRAVGVLAHPTLTVTGSRCHNGTWLLRFEQIPDRTAAEALRGSHLEVEVETQPDRRTNPHVSGESGVGIAAGSGVADGIDPNEPSGQAGTRIPVKSEAGQPDSQWYDFRLVGLRAVSPAGEALGEVAGVEHLPAQDLLSIRRPDGQQRLVPFVAALVPRVDIAAGSLTIDAPPGLLDDPDDAGPDDSDDQDGTE